ncbi:hypothetical protein BJ508DRAFT_204474 [Ascobolus immersus RN42]|uniref:Nuclear segregation protein Bfr1 n=1 Tax=Ascobolus immersus RN42 TaxID=1160509 RepID=A0A3N4IPE5_ASCIM|nr:hypothetical protein BJ508DRAFT_204474 [Ascobolus immersus RN42]
MATEAPKKDVVVLPTTKPTKPDDAKFKEEKEQARKELDEAQAALNAVKAKIDLVQPKRDGPPSETQKRQQALKKELNEIKAQQATHKGSGNKIKEEIAALDADLKVKFAEQKKRKDALPFKTLNELNNAIDRLEREVESGKMRIVEEKRALDNISRMKKQRRNFDDIEAAEKRIAEIRAQIDQRKQTLADPEVKKLSERYDEVAKELADIKKQQEDAYSNLNALRDERTALQKVQNEKFQALRKIQDDFTKARQAYKKWEDEYYKAKKERLALQKKQEERERLRKIAEEKLEEASAPAFEEDIHRCETLIAYFDPSSPEAQTKKSKASLLASKPELQLEQSKLRTIDDSEFKGAKALAKKEDREEEYFMGGGGGKKKGKKGGKKDTSAASAESPAVATKFNLPYGVLESCVEAKITPPSSQAEVASTLEKLRENLARYKRDQKEQTEKVSIFT